MAEIVNAAPCMNVSPSLVCLKDILGAEDTLPGETTPDYDKCINEHLCTLNLEDSDKDFFWDDTDFEEMIGYGETTHMYNHGKFIKVQQAPLYMEDSDKEMTSEDEMGMMCCGHADFDLMDRIYLLQAHQKYFPPQPKPPTWEELDVLLTKKEMEWYDMSLEDLWYSKYPSKEDSEYTLVWSDTDE